MLTNGYIKEYRSLLSWGWFKDPFTAHLWEYLRLAANWDEAVFKGKPVRRGELVTSYVRYLPQRYCVYRWEEVNDDLEEVTYQECTACHKKRIQKMMEKFVN